MNNNPSFQAPPITLPGQSIGILGGGQLGRMFAIAARRMGYRVHSFDPTDDCPTGQVADVEVTAAYDDIEAALHFASRVDVVTFEFENIPAETLQAISEIKPVFPSPDVLHICRHRLREKEFLSKHHFPVAEYLPVKSVEELQTALGRIGLPAILKTADFGYDGKGQTRIEQLEQAGQAWNTLGRPVGVVEKHIDFIKEISVICARRRDGRMMCFPPAENLHQRHILDVTSVPAGVGPETDAQAIDLAVAITQTLQVVGLLTVEMFVLPSGALLVNELAPRPHNSGHYTIDACISSQFEQQLRAVCNLPLGDVTLLRPAAMANLLGDLWEHAEPDWNAALSIPEVKLHLYGKREPRIGRKMGHLTALADSVSRARDRVLQARQKL